MDRKKFIKKSWMAGLAATVLPSIARANKNDSSKEKSTFDKLIDQVGFNHLPNEKEIKQ